jgi:hypothetical protein
LVSPFCAILTSTTITQAQTTQQSEARIYLPGSSILSPTDRSWVPHSEREKGLFLFGKLKYADQGKEKLHSFVFSAHWMFIDFPPEAYLNDQQLLDSLRESLRADGRPEWLKSLDASIDAEKETIIEAPKDQDTSRPIQRMAIRHQCIRYRKQRLDEDRFSQPLQAVLTIELRGVRCLHPFYPQYVIDISFSQRSRKGEWDVSFDSEADRFLQSLEIEPVPLSPYVSKKLNEYASLLNKVQRQTEASKIKQYADKLQIQTSQHLGFDPYMVLLEYADFLRTQNDELEAKRMQILAKMWRANNMAHYLIELQRNATVH